MGVFNEKKIIMEKRILKYSLLAGAVYFILVATAHQIGIKVPVLFVYFNVPSQYYQDQIISFMAFGWAVFLFSAFLNPANKELVRAVLIAGFGAIFGLSIINLKTDFKILSSEINVSYFWAETIGLLFYVLWLAYFYSRINKDKRWKIL